MTIPPPSKPTRAAIEGQELASRLRGRARFLRDRSEIKSPELMEQAAAIIDRAHVWSGDGNRCAVTGFDGPICVKCGIGDTGNETPMECVGRAAG
jgi:hypothetical protein